MYSKVFVFLAAAALASAGDLLLSSNHTKGVRVFDGHFEAQWSIVRSTKDVFVNVSGVITKINVTDLREGKDGEAVITRGGLGHDNVTINLKSPAAFRGYDFLIEVFADIVDIDIQRGNRNIDEPVEVPEETKTPEDKTEGVSTSTVKPTAVTGLPTGTGNPDAAGLPTVTTPVHTAGTPKAVDTTGVPTGEPHTTGLPTKPVETALPKQVVPEDIEEAPANLFKIGFHPPPTPAHKD